MEYMVMIDAFEGPLDLLLHLIKKANIDICEIDVVVVARQYLDYINCMEQFNLDIASEYLVMAAELIEMKSNILFPKIDNDVIEEERQDLINRLLDYKQYRDVLDNFRNLESNRRFEFTKVPEDLRDYGCFCETHLVGNLNVGDLVSAFDKFLVRVQKDKPLNTKIASREYSVSDRCDEICSILKKRKKVEFFELFDYYEKGYVVVTFLAVLNLVRSSNAIISQQNSFGQIYIEEVA